ncbi:hypothetical protein HYO65_gp055 [Tenacibaculum phage PTm1]|uniref:Uncharacterized protein n=2 Tax=Shirahamavirus PTm1 TaxID=2846435 RepID=A0A5S9BZ03_9CAUD|nr:hypothetical protein HYO65_gp055 [Tenacibaculum phage PTm1]BBI90447.1 hypothetical protein [Tenacibaculum phage PTm1]BBI90755.1 hypothetical protein [Tenacibaculum phage PTm5]
MKEDALKLVEDLNDEVQDRNGLEYYMPFEFKSYGWQNSGIYFMGVILWTDENDEREYIGEDTKEDLRTFILREADKILKDLNLKMGAF